MERIALALEPLDVVRCSVRGVFLAPQRLCERVGLVPCTLLGVGDVLGQRAERVGCGVCLGLECGGACAERVGGCAVCVRSVLERVALCVVMIDRRTLALCELGVACECVVECLAFLRECGVHAWRERLRSQGRAREVHGGVCDAQGIFFRAQSIERDQAAVHGVWPCDMVYVHGRHSAGARV